MKKFDASVPRKLFWSDEVPSLSHCPACQALLENEYHSYLVAVRDAQDIQTFSVGSDAGYFCPQCPAVVLDREAMGELASLGLRQSEPTEFTALGIMDLDAVPESKRSMPFDDEDNPLPLVPFTNVSAHPGNRRRTHRSRRKRKHWKGRKRRK